MRDPVHQPERPLSRGSPTPPLALGRTGRRHAASTISAGGCRPSMTSATMYAKNRSWVLGEWVVLVTRAGRRHVPARPSVEATHIGVGFAHPVGDDAKPKTCRASRVPGRLLSLPVIHLEHRIGGTLTAVDAAEVVTLENQPTDLCRERHWSHDLRTRQRRLNWS
jgi:hypothetical protein